MNVILHSAEDGKPIPVDPMLVLKVEPREGGGATLWMSAGEGLPPGELAVIETATDTETKLDEAWDEMGLPYLKRPWG